MAKIKINNVYVREFFSELGTRTMSESVIEPDSIAELENLVMGVLPGVPPVYEFVNQLAVVTVVVKALIGEYLSAELEPRTRTQLSAILHVIREMEIDPRFSEGDRDLIGSVLAS